MFQAEKMVGRRAVLMGMVGAAAGMALVACGGKSKDVTPTTAPASTSAPTIAAGATATAIPINIAPTFGPAPTATTVIPTAQTKPTTAAPTQAASNGSSSSKAPRAKSLLSKEEVEAVLGMPVKEGQELETYDGNHISYLPIGVTVERGGNMAYDLKGFTDSFQMTEPLSEFGNQAFVSESQSDVVVLKDGTLVYIGTAGVKRDGISLDMLKTLMRKALSRI
jgi:hypothetical protein